MAVSLSRLFFIGGFVLFLVGCQLPVSGESSYESDDANDTLLEVTDSFVEDDQYSTNIDHSTLIEESLSEAIEPIIDPPVANADSFIVYQLKQGRLNVLDNDESVGGIIQISIISQAENGFVEVLNDGFVSYAPNASYFGKDEFIYKITNENGDSSVASASIFVECVEKCNAIFTITWEPSVSLNVESYKVYYGAEATSLDQVIELANVTSYEHFVDTKGEYFFAVAAVNDQKIESEITEVVSGIF